MKCFVLFRNGHFQNVVSTFTNVVKFDVENDNVVSTLSNADAHINAEIHNTDSTLLDNVNSNVEIHNAISMLVLRCPTSRHRINQKTTLKQRWNVYWVCCRFMFFILHFFVMQIWWKYSGINIGRNTMAFCEWFDDGCFIEVLISNIA